MNRRCNLVYFLTLLVHTHTKVAITILGDYPHTHQMFVLDLWKQLFWINFLGWLTCWLLGTIGIHAVHESQNLRVDGGIKAGKWGYKKLMSSPNKTEHWIQCELREKLFICQWCHSNSFHENSSPRVPGIVRTFVIFFENFVRVRFELRRKFSLYHIFVRRFFI